VTRRDRIVIGVVLSLAVVGAFWMLALKPKRDQAAKLGKDLSAAHERLDQAQRDVREGEFARAGYAANYSAVARLGKAVPSDDDVPSLVYQLDSTAQSTGVDFRSVKLTSGSGSAPAAPAPATTPAPGADASKGQSGQSGQATPPAQSGSPTTTTASATAPAGPTAPGNATAGPASPTQTATAALPPGAVVGPAGLSTMPFSFKFTGSFFRLDEFLSRLQRYITARRDTIDVSGRLLLVNGIALNAGDGGFPSMQASISATAYLVPPDQGTFNGATPQGPATGASSAKPVSSTPPAPAPTAPATVKP
jgi:hypothetical protein